MSDFWQEQNRRRWDELAAVHPGTAFYGVDRFKAGEDALLPIERAEVGPVAGKSLLHLQCHIGLDTLNWARKGARVTGLDYSGEAVRQALPASKPRRQRASAAGSSASGSMLIDSSWMPSRERSGPRRC